MSNAQTGLNIPFDLPVEEKQAMTIRNAIHWRLARSMQSNLGLMHQYLSRFNPECIIDQGEFMEYLQ